MIRLGIIIVGAMIVVSLSNAQSSALISSLITDGTNQGPSKDVLIIIDDSDEAPSPEIVLTPSTVNVDERSNATFDVFLSVEPTQLVKVKVPAFQTAGLSHDKPDSLEFTPSNYETPQIVTVTSREDANSISESEEIELSSTGGEYEGQTATLNVNVKDLYEFKIIAQSTLAVPEGQFNTLDIRLSHQPSGDVEISIPNVGDLTATPPTLPFTDSNWDTDQSVTLNAAEDADSRHNDYDHR